MSWKSSLAALLWLASTCWAQVVNVDRTEYASIDHYLDSVVDKSSYLLNAKQTYDLRLGYFASRHHLVIYSLEVRGGRGTMQRMALLSVNEAGLLTFAEDIEIGSTTTGAMKFDGLYQGTLRFTSSFFNKDDPLCCPSGIKKIYFVRVDGELKKYEHYGEAKFWAENDLKRQVHSETVFIEMANDGFCGWRNSLPFYMIYKEREFVQALSLDDYHPDSLRELRADIQGADTIGKYVLWRHVIDTFLDQGIEHYSCVNPMFVDYLFER